MLNLYYIDISSGCSYEQSLVLSEYLLPERKKRVDRLKNKDNAEKQILSGIFLQYCLCKTLNIPMNELKLLYNSNGKPYIDDKGLFFNLSHSGDYAVLAVSDSDVGIDIERMHEKRLNVAKRCFCKEEYEDIVSAGDKDAQNKRFLEYWTMKEAFVKCCGLGLVIPLNSFRIIYNNEVYIAKFISESEYIRYDELSLRVFDFEKDYQISICTSNRKNLVNMNADWKGNSNVIMIDRNDIFEMIH